MTKKTKSFQRLVAEAKKDPKLLHALVFNPEKVIADLDYLDKREKSMLIALRAEDVLSGMLGLISGPGGGLAVCGYSCDDSCDDTCGAGSCFGTCLSDSCDHTCGARSCDVTVEIAGAGFIRPAFIRDIGRPQFRPRRRS